LTISCLIGCIGTSHQTTREAEAIDVPKMTIPAELAPQIELAVNLESAIYLQDKVSAIGADVLQHELGSF
jgi:hypothetical protein